MTENVHRVKNKRKPPPPRRLYRTAELAAIFGVTDRTIRRWLSDGYLRCLVLRGQRRVEAAEVERLIALGKRGKA